MEANEKKNKDDWIEDERQRHHRRFTYDSKIAIPKKSVIIIPNDVTDVTVDSSVISIRESAFFYCSVLVHVEFSSAPSCLLQTISSSAFQYCTGLQLISLPPSLISIGPLAFSGCTSLTKVEWLPDTSSTAFNKQSSTSVSPQNEEQQQEEGADSSMLQSIGGYAFAGCQSLLSMTLPRRVTKLSQGTFQGCTMLEMVNLSAHSTTSLKSIGSCALEECISLQSISVPKTVHTIGTSAFSGCHSLQQVNLCHRGGQLLRSIGRKAFSNCRSLSAISIPASVNDVGNEAFLGCTGLLGLEIPVSSRVQLEKSCFAGCSSLIVASIPTSVTYLPYDCFSQCRAMLKHIRKEPGEPSSSSSSVSLHPILRNRYEGLPIHQVCYHAATCSMEDLEVAIQLLFSNNPNNSTTTTTTTNSWREDVFGITPLHILASISTIRTDFWKVLLNRYSLDIIWHKDVNGKSIMDYLMLPHQSCKVIPLIQMALHRIIIAEMKVNHPWGLQSWIDIMASLIDSIGSSDHVEDQVRSNAFVSRQQDLQLIQDALAGYLKLEAISILELAVWKLKIGCLSGLKEEVDDTELDRTPLRSISGVSILIPNVVGYLWDEVTPASDFAHCMLPLDVAPTSNG